MIVISSHTKSILTVAYKRLLTLKITKEGFVLPYKLVGYT